ncbi:hypothetical protein LCGC14_0523120 [marine sediment metagenome]|uniref:Uncharacterized protein n=1 Tax=marine sediment metagenome TaxID=412755 RepID=A0A0F9UJD8_9ZZZZ
MILCLAIVALLWIQRKTAVVVAHKFGKKLEDSEVWRELVLPVGPIVTGALLMLVPLVPVPAVFAGGVLVKMVFGGALGLISGLVYRLIKKNILNKMGKINGEAPNTEK